MMNQTKIIIILIIIIAVITGISTTLFIKSGKIEAENNQIKARLEDSLKVLIFENKEYLHRIADVQNLNDSLSEVYNKLNLKVHYQTNQIIKLNSIISDITGTINIIPIDSTDSLRVFSFKDSTEFYKLEAEVFDSIPPTLKHSIDFNPFGIKINLGRNKLGIWSGILELEEWAQKWVKIKDFDIIVDYDEFSSSPEDISLLKIGFSTQLSLNKDLKSIIALGGTTLIKETHLINLSKSLNSDDFYILYSYLL